MQSSTNKDKKYKTPLFFLINYSAIIHAISIYKFTSFQLINLSNLKTLIVALWVGNMGQWLIILEGRGLNIYIYIYIPRKKIYLGRGPGPLWTPLGPFPHSREICTHGSNMHGRVLLQVLVRHDTTTYGWFSTHWYSIKPYQSRHFCFIHRIWFGEVGKYSYSSLTWHTWKSM